MKSKYIQQRLILIHNHDINRPFILNITTKASVIEKL